MIVGGCGRGAAKLGTAVGGRRGSGHSVGGGSRQGTGRARYTTIVRRVPRRSGHAPGDTPSAASPLRTHGTAVVARSAARLDTRGGLITAQRVRGSDRPPLGTINAPAAGRRSTSLSGDVIGAVSRRPDAARKERPANKSMHLTGDVMASGTPPAGDAQL
jgi:hypothetical protein